MAENEEMYVVDELPTALVIAGIEELEKHGLHDFSLRRVANRCGVSCAAPYRHFSSKTGLILSIIAYVNKQWTVFGEQIISAHEGDVRSQIIELCVANIKFWNANPTFRYIMLLDKNGLDELGINERNYVGGMLSELICTYCRENNLSQNACDKLYFSVRALLYGSAQMLMTGELENTPVGFSFVRERLLELFC